MGNKDFKLFLKRYFPKISYYLYSFKNHDAKLRNLFLNYHKFNLVFDIGAHIGLYAHSVRHNGFDGRIISFEPQKKAFDQLLDLSRKDELWHAENYALGNFDGESEMNISENSVSSSILDIKAKSVDIVPETRYISKEKILVKKIDSVINDFYNDGDKLFVKIDSQGYEKRILEGALNSLENIGGLQLELSLEPLYKDASDIREMLDLLDDMGYNLVSFEYGWHDLNSGHMMEVDGIFLKRK